MEKYKGNYYKLKTRTLLKYVTKSKLIGHMDGSLIDIEFKTSFPFLIKIN